MGAPSKAGPALRALRKGQVERALEMFKKLLIQDPNDVGCLVGMARAQLSRKRYEDAVPLLRTVLKFAPDHTEAQSHLALIDLVGGKAQALDVLRRLALSKKAGFFEFFNVATALSLAGDLQGAQIAYERAQAADPKNPQVRVELGRLRMRRGQHREAVADFQKAVELSPNDPLPVLLLSSALAATGDHGFGAEAVGKALLAMPQSAPLHERMVELSLLAGWPQKAIKSAMALRQMNRHSPGYAYLHGMAMLASGLVPEACHIFADTLEKVPQAAAVRQALAQALLLMGEDASAQAVLEEAVQQHPTAAGPACDLALAYLRAADGAGRAQKVLRRALESNPDHPALLLNLAVALARGGDRAGARAQAQRAQAAAGADAALASQAAELLTTLG
jgi:tetratricopeptide (TPR) repeat protein